MPKYQKVFEALFFASFLALYYAVLVERNPRHITPIEVLLYIWIAAFAYDEFGEFRDAGRLFYAQDFWSIWDLGIIGVGAAYLIASKSGLLWWFTRSWKPLSPRPQANLSGSSAKDVLCCSMLFFDLKSASRRFSEQDCRNCWIS